MQYNETMKAILILFLENSGIQCKTLLIYDMQALYKPFLQF